MHIHVLSSSLSWWVLINTHQRSFLVTAWGYNPTFRHLLWQNVQGKILAAMCGIKCIKTLLFAFNFIFWVGVINSELVLVLFSCTVQLKFIGNLHFSATAVYVETLTKSVSVFGFLLIPFSFRAFYSPFDDSKTFLISPLNIRPITGFSIFSRSSI